MNAQALYAAIDLGSNSFHLVIMARKDQRLVWVDGKKEMIRLASGINRNTGELHASTKNRALRCLRHFGQALKGVPVNQIKAVGTSAFRRLSNSSEFMAEAEATLGLPIQILTGQDEAKYIYRGVAKDLPEDTRFVLDIGGGSTEMILGRGKEVQKCHSLEMGCLTLTERFFRDGIITPSKIEQCEAFIQKRLNLVQPHFSERIWMSELGTSGSIKAISWALQNLNLTQGEVTREGMEDLRNLVYQSQNNAELASKIKLNKGRTSVFVAGFIMLDKIFRSFGLSYMRVSQGAIREGLIDELMNP